MKKHVDAQTYLSSLRVKELVDKGPLKRDSCSSAVLRGLEHVEKSQYRTQAYKDKQIQLYNTMKVRRHNHGEILHTVTVYRNSILTAIVDRTQDPHP